MAKKAPSKTKKSSTARTTSKKSAARTKTSPKPSAARKSAPKSVEKSASRTNRPATGGATRKPPVSAAAARKSKPATSSRPKKNATGLGKRDLEYFRDMLLEKRRELVGDMSSMEREALNPSGGSNLSNLPVHMADMGTDNYEQEFTLGLVEKDRTLLREINLALMKIQDGSYGVCEGTGNPIGRPRLEAKPWARYSIEYARKLEQGLVR